jgi:hypothetical protein
MTHTALLLLLAGILAGASASAYGERSLPTVMLDSATVTGISSGSVKQFLGIPFAQPPYVPLIDQHHCFTLTEMQDRKPSLPGPAMSTAIYHQFLCHRIRSRMPTTSRTVPRGVRSSR